MNKPDWERNPERCDRVIRAHGTQLAMDSGTRTEMEQRCDMVQEQHRDLYVDWFYMAGRGVFLGIKPSEYWRLAGAEDQETRAAEMRKSTYIPQGCVLTEYEIQASWDKARLTAVKLALGAQAPLDFVRELERVILERTS